MSTAFALLIIIVNGYAIAIERTTMTTCLAAKQQIEGFTARVYCVEIKP